MRKTGIIIFIILFLGALKSKAAFEYSVVNPDVAALGGAFTGMADSTSAIFYNPAGLGLINTKNIEFDYTSLYNMSAVENYCFSATMPFVWKGSVGIAVNYQGINDDLPLKDFSEEKFYFSYGARLYDWLLLGYSFKYFYAVYDKNKSAAYSGDIGLLLFFEKFKLGVFYYDFYSPIIEWYSGREEILYKNLRIGLSISVIDNLIVIFDNDRLLDNMRSQNVHLGMRYDFTKYKLSVSAGLMSLYLNKFSITGGISYSFRGATIKYTYINHYDLGSSNLIGISLKF